MNFGMRHFSFVNAKKITPKIIENILSRAWYVLFVWNSFHLQIAQTSRRLTFQDFLIRVVFVWTIYFLRLISQNFHLQLLDLEFTAQFAPTISSWKWFCQEHSACPTNKTQHDDFKFSPKKSINGNQLCFK